MKKLDWLSAFAIFFIAISAILKILSPNCKKYPVNDYAVYENYVFIEHEEHDLKLLPLKEVFIVEADYQCLEICYYQDTTITLYVKHLK